MATVENGSVQQNGVKENGANERPSPKITEKPSVKASPYFPLEYEPKELQKVVKEAILLAGGAVAMLLQMANPGVGQGVNEHSNFSLRITDRLRVTMTYIYTITFGTTDEKVAIIDMVHRAHDPVNGPNYDANDPDLQLWVAATLYASGVDIYEKIFGPFDAKTSEKIYEEYSIFATSLRVPAGKWPAGRRAFWDYWDAKIEMMEVTSHAAAVAKDVLWPKKAPIWIKANMPIVRMLTAELLPPRLRDAYGLKTSRLNQSAYRAVMGILKAVYPHLPNFIRTVPQNYYLKDMRRRMKK
ncbi:hypothetical protein AJ78_04678 [Emergomyces pasteurianus Ep9510]|uniref:ER-bound oxygenase mpaB/mpaB'/Rubber oxygenase catalytic domain-containing protein n=1 Tax=Emergomyces pasteurianus Ep9510 TaxID=1447872 RepID=A0A1J9QFU9_9EURO|nr:hypothetical protein AJ78_04678 [Emergomyces pasteurianus Ep9510]